MGFWYAKLCIAALLQSFIKKKGFAVKVNVFLRRAILRISRVVADVQHLQSSGYTDIEESLMFPGLFKPIRSPWRRRVGPELPDDADKIFARGHGLDIAEFESDLVYSGIKGHNPKYKVPKGKAYRWVRIDVYGSDAYSNEYEAKDNGWRPVPHKRHAHMPTSVKGKIVHGGFMLMERSKKIDDMAKINDLRVAIDTRDLALDQIKPDPEADNG